MFKTIYNRHTLLASGPKFALIVNKILTGECQYQLMSGRIYAVYQEDKTN